MVSTSQDTNPFPADGAPSLGDRRLQFLLERVYKTQALHQAAVHRLHRRCRAVARTAPTAHQDIATRLDQRELAWQRAVHELTQPRGTGLTPDPLLGSVQRPLWTDETPVARTKAEARPLPVPSFQRGMGLNGMKAFQWEDTYTVSSADATTEFGAGPYELNDAANLGVSQARQFGPRDLRWDLLVAWDDPGRRVPIPYDPDELRSLVLGGWGKVPVTNVDRFAALLGAAWKRDVKLRFTFLTLGGGSTRLVNSADADTTSLEGGLTADLTDAVTVPHSANQSNVLRQYWSPDYLDAEGLSADSDEGRYYLVSLDMSVLAKKQAVRTFASACAALLVQAERAVKAGAAVSPDGSPLSDDERDLFSLDQVLDGIEIGNEIEVRSIVNVGTSSVSPTDTAELWAGAWLHAAIGFIETFRSLRGTHAALPTLYLPGLASVSQPDIPGGAYSDTSAASTWNWKYDFLDAMLERIRTVWRLLRTFPASLTYHLPPLADALGGIDYHWYHFQNRGKGGTTPGDILGPLHSGWLISDVAALAGLLDDHGLDARVTVFESGTTARFGTNNAYMVTAGKAPGTTLTDAEGQAFQADEVWRRLLAAKAGGAEQAGWHAWMASSPTYTAFGFRKEGDTTTHAPEATARPSWFSFQRLATLVRDASTVQIVRPSDIPDRSSLVLEAGGTDGGVVPFPSVLVYEIEGLAIGELGGTDTSRHHYAYVALVDCTVSDADPISINVQAPTGDAPDVLSLEPFTTTPEDWAIPIPPAI